jgi:glyoxylase-like metal-dependent hydrolase (beta-lactamase superfamily II)
MGGELVGSVELLPLSDGSFSRPPSRFFPDVPADSWVPYREDYLDADGNVVLNLGCFLVRADGVTILVDTGIGPHVNLGGHSGSLLEEMETAGVAREAVDVVLTTHMHLDHIGWNTVERDGAVVPTFPRARYLVQRIEWEWAMSLTGDAAAPIDRAGRPLEPAGVVDLVDGEHAVTPSVRFLPTPGHTPGHSCILIDSNGQQGVILGDVAHSPVQVPQPEWSVGADVDKDRARASREALWDRIAEHGLTVAAGHFPPPNVGRFVRVEGRRYWRAR